MRAVVPAEKAELVSVAKAMHRERFGRTVQELFNLEREAALKAIKTGRAWGSGEGAATGLGADGRLMPSHALQAYTLGGAAPSTFGTASAWVTAPSASVGTCCRSTRSMPVGTGGQPLDSLARPLPYGGPHPPGSGPC